MKANDTGYQENYVYNALKNKVGKVVEITYVIGNGPNTNTGHYLVDNLDKIRITVRKTVWNNEGKRVPVGNAFVIPLELIISFPHGGTRANFDDDQRKK